MLEFDTFQTLHCLCVSIGPSLDFCTHLPIYRFAVDYVPSCALAINDVIHPSMNHSLRDAPDA
jgi:hypothetical protein